MIQVKKWPSQLAMLIKKQKIGVKLLLITSVITLCNVGAGIFIYTQNLSVANAVKDSNELANAEREYKQVSDLVLRTMLLMIDSIQNQEGDFGTIKENIDAMPGMFEHLLTTFEIIDRKYPAGEDELAYSNQVKVYELAYTSLKEVNLENNQLSAEAKALRVQSLIRVYTVTLSYGNANIEERLNTDVATTEARLNKSLSTSNIIVIINVLLLAVLPYLMSSSLNRDIKRGLLGIMGRINAYKNSDFTYNNKLVRYDEFGDIDRSLSDMGDNLRDTIKSTLDVSQSVLIASMNMGDMVERNRTASEQVKGQVELGRKILLSQYDDASSISAVTEQISASSQEIAASSDYINSDMQQMEQSSRVGSQDMEGVVQMVNQTVEQFERVTEAFDRITERYGNVAKFLEGIQDLNTQTNLLSLNASIESARAGEHGRGFAVVAEEIRKLSGQTDMISKNITKELKQIQNDVAASSQRLGAFAQVISTTKEASVTASDMFKGLERQSSALSGQVGEISTAISEITSGMTHIVTAVDKLLETSSDVNGKMENMSTMSQEQYSVSDQLQGLAEQLKTSSCNLKEKAAVFKV
ncbi:MAG: methyl-accepting chemotaxis protein [Candidatus Pristimantibacillus sp.]